MVDDTTSWSQRLRQTLEQYDEALLQEVAGRLVRVRNQWPADELIERCLAATENDAVLDRRLQDLEPAGRQLLAVMAHSRQPRWRLGNLVELAMALGQQDGLKPVLGLLAAGLLYPDTSPARPPIKSFEQWLGQAGSIPLHVYTLPGISSRAQGEDLGLPALRASEETASATASLVPVREADGLEWLLRLAVLWQRVSEAPLRRTQDGGFFKRDVDRLVQGPLLGGAPADSVAPLPDPAFLAVALAECVGALKAADGEQRAGALPASWEDGLLPALAALWSTIPCLETWSPMEGWRGTEAVGNPFPSACLLAALLLARLPPDGWARPADLEQWVVEHHPYWAGEDVRPSLHRGWIEAFLLGFGYPLRLVQARQGGGDVWLVRLSAVGRWLLGLGEAPALGEAPSHTLLVQPNLEIIAYRQGLTPALVARLSRLASWKSLGPACTLQLEPETVYRALESGLTFEEIVRTLEQHGTRTTPTAVLESLRTWAGKRDRIAVYPSAALLEFPRPEDLQEALSRGLPAVRLSDRLAVVANESAIEFKHFRLAGTRDYSLPPERCVEVEADGVTLNVDVTRSDLLLESELARFAEPVDRPGAGGRRPYRLTPASLAAGRAAGLTESGLEAWFMQRTAQPMSPAARMLLGNDQLAPPRFERLLVLHVANEEVADGILQWPDTRALVAHRLGPTVLAVAERDVGTLTEKLRALGMKMGDVEPR